MTPESIVALLRGVLDAVGASGLVAVVIEQVTVHLLAGMAILLIVTPYGRAVLEERKARARELKASAEALEDVRQTLRKGGK